MKRMWSKNELAKQVKEVKKDITTLVDSQGHERFIEGDITLTNDAGEGITKTFGKWSLSGTHLLFVLGVDFGDGYTLVNGTTFASCILPNWLYNKIINLWSVAIDSKVFAVKGDDWSSQNATIVLSKSSENKITMFYGGNLTISGTKHGRIAFDLLIDND